MTTTSVTVTTVGLDETRESELTVQLAANPQIDLQHFAAWDPRLLQADVIVLDTDTGAGQHTLDMLRYYAGVKQPILVTHSRHDALFQALRGTGGVPPFETRLQVALHRAGCSTAFVCPAAPDPGTVRRSRTLLEKGGCAPNGIRWRG